MYQSSRFNDEKRVLRKQKVYNFSIFQLTHGNECSSHNGSYETRNTCVAEPREAKGKGSTEKNKQTNKETKQQQKEEKQCSLLRLEASKQPVPGVQIVERGGYLNAWNRLAGKGLTHSRSLDHSITRSLAANVDRFINLATRGIKMLYQCLDFLKA